MFDVYKDNPPGNYVNKIFICFLLFLSFDCLLFPQMRDNVAVVNVQAIDLSENNAYAFTTKLRSEIFSLDVFNVMEREQMEEILNEQKRSVSECFSDECVIEIGQLLSVNFIITGSIQYLKKMYLIDIRLIDVETSQIVSNVNVTWEGSFGELISKFTTQISNELIAKYLTSKHLGYSSGAELVKEQTGYLTFNLSQRDVIMFIDGTPSGKQPYQEITLKLSPGKHTIRFVKEGFKEWIKTYNVITDKTIPVVVNLIPEEKITSMSSEESQYGMLIINTDPDNAEVTVDNVLMGQTPFQKKIDVGKHVIHIRKSLYHPYKEEIKVSSGEFTKKEINLLPNFGSLTISSSPEGARIFIDNVPREEKTPASIPRIESGIHTLKIQLEDYHEWTKEIIISDNIDLPIKASLKPAFGQLKISSVPEGAKVYIDEKFKGTTPLMIERAYSRNYTIKIEKEYYKPWESTVTVKDGENVKIHQVLAKNFGTLIVNSLPKGSKIFLDDSYISETPFTIEKVNQGEHRLRIEKGEHYIPIEKDLYVAVGEVKTISDNLEPRIGTLLIASNPSGASVYIDGEYRGKTEVKLDNIWAGKREIRIEYPGYSHYKTIIDVPFKGTEFLTAELEKLVYIVPRKEVLWRSIVLPGWGHFYSNRGIQWVIYPFLITSIMHTHIGLHIDYIQQEDVYNKTLDIYLSSTGSTEELSELWSNVKIEHDKLKSIYRKEAVTLSLLGIVWFANVVDAYLFVPKMESQHEISFQLEQFSKEVIIKLSFKF